MCAHQSEHALSRSGTQPVVGVFEDYPIWQWNILSSTGEVMGREHFQGETFYYHKDLLGSTRAIITDAGLIDEVRTYDAWGVLLEGRYATSVGADNTHEGYTGKERDEESITTANSGTRSYTILLIRSFPTPACPEPAEGIGNLFPKPAAPLHCLSIRGLAKSILIGPAANLRGGSPIRVGDDDLAYTKYI